MSIKIIEYFTIKMITTGFFIAFLSAAAMYLDWAGVVNHLLNTIFGVLTLYGLLQSDKKVWFWSGFWIGVLWFWWISMSFSNYGFPWAIPIGVILTSVVYGYIFLFVVKIAEWIEAKIYPDRQPKLPHTTPIVLLLKVLALLTLSYLHPFEFDWFKPELIFTNSYLGIQKWQFAITLLALALTIYKMQEQQEMQSTSKGNPLLFLLLIIFAYPFAAHFNQKSLLKNSITLTNSMTTVEEKWNPDLQPTHVDAVFKKINRAISDKKEIIVFPESIFAFFLNTKPNLMTALQSASNEITIIIGGLYWDHDETPRNSTYIFKEGGFSIANKAVLVPFGEHNPLPKWMGDIINEIFFDGAPDYVASTEVTDYTINGVTYRNAICFEASSEELYVGEPEQMIVISNNGWVTPSIEPTQQKILLQYYSKKYGTTIYHSVNMSPSYTVHNGKIIK